MLSEQDRTRLLHIREATKKATDFLGQRSRDEMADDEQLTLALVRLIEIVGEAAKNLSPETRERAPKIPWKSICGMRDRLVHAYFDVNLQLVWEAVHDEMPPLLRHVDDLLQLDETS